MYVYVYILLHIIIILLLNNNYHFLGLPSSSDSKESACNVEDQDSIPGLEDSPKEGNGNPLQYSSLENPMGKGA